MRPSGKTEPVCLTGGGLSSHESVRPQFLVRLCKAVLSGHGLTPGDELLHPFLERHLRRGGRPSWATFGRSRSGTRLIVCVHITSLVPNITLALPKELNRKMKAHPEIKWSEVVRRLLAERIRDLERLDALRGRSALTLLDVEELDRLIKEGLRRRFEAVRRSSGG